MAAVAAQGPMATTEQQLTAVAIELGPAVTATAVEQRCMPAMVVAVAMAIVVVQIATTATADLGNAVVASAATAAGMGPASTQDIATIDSMAIEKHIAKQSLVVPAQVPAKADHTVPAFATDHCLASSYFI